MEGPSGPGFYLHPRLLNTPLALFCLFFFRNVTEPYELRNDTCFLSVMLQNLTDHVIIPFFGFRDVTKPHLIMQRCFHLIFGVSRKLTDCASIFFGFPACPGISQIA